MAFLLIPFTGRRGADQHNRKPAALIHIGATFGRAARRPPPEAAGPASLALGQDGWPII